MNAHQKAIPCMEYSPKPMNSSSYSSPVSVASLCHPTAAPITTPTTNPTAPPIKTPAPTPGRAISKRDVDDFRDHLRRERGQAVATINRALVTVRRFFVWLVEQGHIVSNPAKKVKELRRQSRLSRLGRTALRIIFVKFCKGDL